MWFYRNLVKQRIDAAASCLSAKARREIGAEAESAGDLYRFWIGAAGSLSCETRRQEAPQGRRTPKPMTLLEQLRRALA